ncbi:hypothetical protein [Desulfobulbus oligotrophicus]|uniref:Uncharacterized protein n=1 Tax=Desulfobulbus oligotrophicus TaxID=1909699 RepID=A0A7T5VE97_9BACT|nr:hypothetical protein [Desulfobulbus oligotrophicus]QQG66298.1 hypothetical protein HP555_10705 [Desulfobulbus oligotrophicus]
MELFNFSAEEAGLINRSLKFISEQEIRLDDITDRTLVIKTESFAEACADVSRYFPEIGLENVNARAVFNTSKNGYHKILINKETISDLSYIHTIIIEVVHLSNLNQFVSNHGNVYRLDIEQAIQCFFNELLLWSKFQAMKIATRVHALITWHTVNGEEPPADGRYQFIWVSSSLNNLYTSIQAVGQATTSVALREKFRRFLEELALYFGRLAFYQREPLPLELDEQFPALQIDEIVGLNNCLSFYAALQRATNYSAWDNEKDALRRAMVAMQQHSAQRLSAS